jgi:hypothetical protein
MVNGYHEATRVEPLVKCNPHAVFLGYDITIVRLFQSHAQRKTASDSSCRADPQTHGSAFCSEAFQVLESP